MLLPLSARRSYRVWRALAFAEAAATLNDEALEALKVRIKLAGESLAGGRP